MLLPVFTKLKKTLGEIFSKKSFLLAYRVLIEKNSLFVCFNMERKQMLCRERICWKKKKKGNWKFSATFLFQKKLCCWNLYCLNKVNFYCLRKMPRLPPALLFVAVVTVGFLTSNGFIASIVFFQNGLMRQKVNFKFLFKLFWGFVDSFFFWGTTPKASSTLTWRSCCCFYC